MTLESAMTHSIKGINPKDISGARKPNISLVPSSAIIGIADCMQDGAKKYGPYNWRDPQYPVQYTTYLSAAMRHISSFLDGEDSASDSGKDHLAHALSGLCVLYDAIAVGNAVDDRPIPGKTAALIEYFTNKQ